MTTRTPSDQPEPARASGPTLDLPNPARRLNRLRRILVLQARDGEGCAICGAPFSDKNPPTFDHIIPLSKGGPSTLENLQLAHQLCNNRRADTGGSEWSRAHRGRAIGEVGLG